MIKRLDSTRDENSWPQRRSSDISEVNTLTTSSNQTELEPDEKHEQYIYKDMSIIFDAIFDI